MEGTEETKEEARLGGHLAISEVVSPSDLLKAHPTFDIWSFAVVLYRVIAHKPLLEADDRDNLRSKRELITLAT